MTTQDNQGFSLLAHCQPARDLETALAEYLLAAKVGSPEMAIGNRLFARMTPLAQYRVRFAMTSRRAA